MSKKPDAKRQLFRGLMSKKSSTFDITTQNLLSKTLRKQSDKYKRDDEQEFVIHKTTSPEDYLIFNTSHPIRESKLQALEQSEQAFQELFHHHGGTRFEDSGSEDDEPDLSSFAAPSQIYDDDILISVPGYSKEEITASKRLNINDRKNVRLSKVSNLERAFTNKEFLKTLTHERLQEYNEINQEYYSCMENLKEEKQLRLQEMNSVPHDIDSLTEQELNSFQPYQLEVLRNAVNNLEKDSWMYPASH